MTTFLRRAATIVSISLAAVRLTPSATADEGASYVGGQVCSGCHAAQVQSWKGSHHALAMQEAREATVLGDFAGAQLEHFGVMTTFFRDGDKFMVRTDGPDGALHDYPIAYPPGSIRQQYLIIERTAQALGIAWTAGRKTPGGQRWFHLYPNQKLPAGDRLHWAGRTRAPGIYQCADCHYCLKRARPRASLRV